MFLSALGLRTGISQRFAPYESIDQQAVTDLQLEPHVRVSLRTAARVYGKMFP
jgi:hypothetical protein